MNLVVLFARAEPGFSVVLPDIEVEYEYLSGPRSAAFVSIAGNY